MFINIIILFFLFLLLGLSADFLVNNISYIAKALRIRMFALGIILGIVTSLPETSVGINTSLEGIPGLSVGNLLGSIVVIMGLILGCSLILNRRINTDGELKIVIPQIAIIFIPLFLGLDGNYNLVDGIIMILSYLSLVFYLYKANYSFGDGLGVAIIERNKILKAISFSLIGIAAILFFSHWIVEVTTILLEGWSISKLTIGILVFSIGTNLPEISIALTSWRKKNSELSLSHLMSSAFTNVLILGGLSTISTISFTVNHSYYNVFGFIALVLFLFVIFYWSKKRLDRWEGGILALCYLIFLILNFVLIP